MDLKLLKMRCKDNKQHHVMFHELYSVSLLLCIAQNVRFEIPYKVLYFETPFLIIFKYYAWVSCGFATTRVNMRFRPENSRDSAQGSIQCRKCIGSPVVRTDGRTDVRTDGHVTTTSLPKFFGLIDYQISLAMELR